MTTIAAMPATADDPIAAYYAAWHDRCRAARKAATIPSHTTPGDD